MHSKSVQSRPFWYAYKRIGNVHKSTHSRVCAREARQMANLVRLSLKGSIWASWPIWVIRNAQKFLTYVWRRNLIKLWSKLSNFDRSLIKKAFLATKNQKKKKRNASPKPKESGREPSSQNEKNGAGISDSRKPKCVFLVQFCTKLYERSSFWLHETKWFSLYKSIHFVHKSIQAKAKA